MPNTYNTYVVGGQATVTGTFTNLTTGAVADPSGTINVTVTTPSGVSTIYVYLTDAITRSSIGVYTFDIDLDEDGIWYYYWWSTGTGQAADEENFTVKSVQALS